jgi:hypothetical protein
LVSPILKEAIGAYAHVEDRTWLEWGSALLPGLQKTVDDELAVVTAAEELRLKTEEDRKRKEAEERVRQAKAQADAAREADRKRREDEVTEAFDENRISRKECLSQLEAIDKEFAPPSIEKRAPSPMNLDGEDGVQAGDDAPVLASSKRPTKRKASVIEEEDEGDEEAKSNVPRVRIPFFYRFEIL